MGIETIKTEVEQNLEAFLSRPDLRQELEAAMQTDQRDKVEVFYCLYPLLHLTRLLYTAPIREINESWIGSPRGNKLIRFACLTGIFKPTKRQMFLGCNQDIAAYCKMLDPFPKRVLSLKNGKGELIKTLIPFVRAVYDALRGNLSTELVMIVFKTAYGIQMTGRDFQLVTSGKYYQSRLE
jgi:hypothetical protein